MNLLEHLQKTIRGQVDAVRRFSNAIERGERLGRESDSPRSVSLLLGPTGVGKTEVILETGRFLYGQGLPDSEKTYAGICRVDMGEYTQANSVDRLLSPTESPFLSAFQRMSDRPSFIFHFDEFEKAHEDIFKMFLGINDAARVTLSDRTKLNFSRCHLVYTANIGGKEAVATDELPYDSIEKNVLRAAVEKFSPEQLQRFREKIVLTGLDYETQIFLCRRWLEKELSIQGSCLYRVIRADEQVINFLIDKGYSKENGARNMQNVIRAQVGDALLPLAPMREDTDVFSGMTVLEVAPDYNHLIARSGGYTDLYSVDQALLTHAEP